MVEMYRLPQEIKLTGEFPGPSSRALAHRRSQAVPASVASGLPVYAADADGGVIIDVDGNSLADLGAGIAVTTVGASAPKVVQAVQESVTHFTHTCFMVTPYEGYIAVSEKLNELIPGRFEKRSVLFNSGAEAVENAVKIARAATGRNAVVVFDHAYHGRTNLTMALTAKVAPYKKGFGPFAPEIYRAPMSYPYRDDQSMDGKEAAQRTINMIEKQIGSEYVAAILIELSRVKEGSLFPPMVSYQRWLHGHAKKVSSLSLMKYKLVSAALANGLRVSTRALNPIWSPLLRALLVVCRFQPSLVGQSFLIKFNQED